MDKTIKLQFLIYFFGIWVTGQVFGSNVDYQSWGIGVKNTSCSNGFNNHLLQELDYLLDRFTPEEEKEEDENKGKKLQASKLQPKPPKLVIFPQDNWASSSDAVDIEKPPKFILFHSWKLHPL